MPSRRRQRGEETRGLAFAARRFEARKNDEVVEGLDNLVEDSGERAT